MKGAASLQKRPKGSIICMMIGKKAAMIGHLARCMTQYVRIVDRRPRFHSNQIRIGRSTAGIVTRKGDLPSIDPHQNNICIS